MMKPSKAKLIEYIGKHGHAVDIAHTDPNTIRAEETGTKQGGVYAEWVFIPANLKAVRDWLGY